MENSSERRPIIDQLDRVIDRFHEIDPDGTPDPDQKREAVDELLEKGVISPDVVDLAKDGWFTSEQ